MNIDSAGIRRTWYSFDNEDALQVMILGGSAMWGWMVPDSLTIASLVQQKLNQTSGRGNADVLNLAENGFTSTQELIQLILRLQKDLL